MRSTTVYPRTQLNNELQGFGTQHTGERERENATKVFAGWDGQYFAGSNLSSFRGIGNVIGFASDQRRKADKSKEGRWL